MKCLIYPIGLLSNTYEITIFTDGVYVVKQGTKLENQQKLITVNKEESIILEKKELHFIRKLLSVISQYDEIRTNEIRKGAWKIIIFIDNKEFQFYLGDQFKDLNTLYDEIIKISPLTIITPSYS